MHYFVEPIGDNPKYRCGTRHKNVNKTHKAIRLCNYKLHIKCNKTDEKKVFKYDT